MVPSSLNFNTLKEELLLFSIRTFFVQQNAALFFCEEKFNCCDTTGSGIFKQKVVELHNWKVLKKSWLNICDCMEQVFNNFDNHQSLCKNLHMTPLGITAFLSLMQAKYNIAWPPLPSFEDITCESLLNGATIH